MTRTRHAGGSRELPPARIIGVSAYKARQTNMPGPGAGDGGRVAHDPTAAIHLIICGLPHYSNEA
jgi:hypothetical protein